MSFEELYSQIQETESEYIANTIKSDADLKTIKTVSIARRRNNVWEVSLENSRFGNIRLSRDEIFTDKLMAFIEDFINLDSILKLSLYISSKKLVIQTSGNRLYFNPAEDVLEIRKNDDGLTRNIKPSAIEQPIVLIKAYLTTLCNKVHDIQKQQIAKEVHLETTNSSDSEENRLLCHLATLEAYNRNIITGSPVDFEIRTIKARLRDLRSPYRLTPSPF